MLRDTGGDDTDETFVILAMLYGRVSAGQYIVNRQPVRKATSPAKFLGWILNDQPSASFRQDFRMEREFHTIGDLIKDHPVFHNSSRNPQWPVTLQLAVMLYRLGHNGNGTSFGAIINMSGLSVGAIKKYEGEFCCSLPSAELAIFNLPLHPNPPLAE